MVSKSLVTGEPLGNFIEAPDSTGGVRDCSETNGSIEVLELGKADKPLDFSICDCTHAFGAAP